MTPRILVVEDEELQQIILKSALEAHGYEVDTCADGVAAVEKVSAGQYNMVLLDYRLPEIDGLAAARLIADLMGRAARPLLIALTADATGLLDREGLSPSAFDAVIAKSDGLPALLATIDTYLKSGPSRAAREAANAALMFQLWHEYDADPWWQSEVAQALPLQARILVVEDDEVQCLILKSALEAHGYDVETASDGLEAFRKIRARGYDLAIVDYQLPEIDGLAIGRMVRNVMTEAVRPRLIALTATPGGLIGREAASPESGGTSVYDMVISKSVELTMLLASVNECLRSAAHGRTRLAAEAAFRSGAATARGRPRLVGDRA